MRTNTNFVAEDLSDLECILTFSLKKQVCCLPVLEIRLMCVVCAACKTNNDIKNTDIICVENGLLLKPIKD